MSERKEPFRWVMAVVTWMMLFALGASWFSFTPMTVILMEQLSISFQEVGVIIALVPLSLVILCIPGGLFADRFGIRPTVTIGGLLMAVFGLLRGFSTDFTTLAITTFLCGAGYSIAYPNLPKVTGRWFPPSEYALASGIMFTGMEIGMSLPLILIPAVLIPWTGSWRGVFIFIGILSLMLTFLWIVLAKERPNHAETGSSIEPKGVPFRESLSVVLRNRHMWILMLTGYWDSFQQYSC